MHVEELVNAATSIMPVKRGPGSVSSPAARPAALPPSHLVKCAGRASFTHRYKLTHCLQISTSAIAGNRDNL